MRTEMEAGDIIIAKDEAYSEYKLPKEHRLFKIVYLDGNHSSIVSIQSDEVKLVGIIELDKYFILLNDSRENAMTKAVIGILSSGFQLESFEAKTTCGKTISFK